MFVLEEVRRDFHPIVFGAAFLAAVIANIPARLVSGAFPVFSVLDYPTPPIASLPAFALLGIIAGLLGVAFNRSLLRSLDLFASIQRRWPIVLGALVGLGIGQIVHRVAPGAVPQPAVFAVVGMAAYFAAIVHAPLTGIMLIVEMTGNYQQMLPLLVSCFCAYAVAELLKDLPIYEALFERDLSREGLHAHAKQPMVADFEIQQGAPFAGKELRQLGLPPGCVLVRCIHEGREVVPTAHTRLEPHMRITAIIAPEAQHALAMLREGCKGTLY